MIRVVAQYQIVKMSNGKIILRPQQGWWLSGVSGFKKKKLSYKLSSNWKFLLSRCNISIF